MKGNRMSAILAILLMLSGTLVFIPHANAQPIAGGMEVVPKGASALPFPGRTLEHMAYGINGTAGNTFTVSVWVYNVTGLFSFGSGLYFNTTDLKAVTGSVVEGGFLSNHGTNALAPSPITIVNTPSPTYGYVSCGWSLYDPALSASGSGPLFNATFQVLAGATPFTGSHAPGQPVLMGGLTLAPYDPAQTILIYEDGYSIISPANNNIYNGTFLITTPNLIPPTYSSINHSTTFAGNPCTFSITCSDNVGLSKYIFSFANGISSFTNNTAVAFTSNPQTVSVTKTLTSTVGATIKFRWFFNDTSNNWNSTAIQTFVTTNGTPPTYSNITHSTAAAGASCAFSITCSDNVGLSKYIFSFANGISSFTNNTAVAFTSNPQTVSVTKTLTSTVGATIRFRWFFNDTSNNWNSTAIQSFTTTLATLFTASISPGSVTIDVGQSQIFTSTVSGGTSPYQFQWYLDRVAKGTNSTSWIFTPSISGVYTVSLNVTDHMGLVASSTATVSVNGLPSVTISPGSVIIDVGQSQLFTSAASNGTSPYHYQWYLNGVSILGANNSAWTFTPSSPGSYTVYVNATDNAGNRVKSNTATVTVNSTLSVSISPSSVTLEVGQSKVFTSTVSGGTLPYSYQWYLNGAIVSSATSSSWAFTPSSSGSYTVYVNATDNVGVRVKSNIATVTVNTVLSVSISPSSAIMDVGQSEIFTTTVSGGTLSYLYQWYLNGVSEGTSSSWAFTPGSAGSYAVYVNVTDNAGNRVKSNTATITVNNALSASISPATSSLNVGGNQPFTLTVSGGTASYSYQWYLNGNTISGATSASYTFSTTQQGSYTVYVQVKDSATTSVTAQSNTATITVASGLGVSIASNATVIDIGQHVSFTSSVSGGSGPYSYQWFLNGSAISGITLSTYLFTPSARGHYNFYLNVTDNKGAEAQSSTTTVTVNTALSVSISPSSATLDVGQSQLFTSTVSGGTSPYTYQWYLNGVAVSGATSASWAFTPSSSGSYNVYVNVTDSVNLRAKSNIASVTVNSALSVTVSPSSVVMDVGQPQSFTASVSGGTSPYTYQWYLDGSPVSSATGATWTYTAVAAGSHSVYVKVTDSATTPVTASSNTASVTVNAALSVTVAPASVTLDVDQPQTFTSTVSGGTSPFSYQWYLDGNLVSGATSVTWTYTAVAAGSHSVYVKVTDSATTPVTASSNTASVTVNAGLSVSIVPTSVTLDGGQSKQFNATITGGTGPYSYQWYLDSSLVSGATSATWTYAPSASGSHTIYVKVVDSASTPVTATSNTASVAVNGALSVSIVPTSVTLDVGQSKQFNATVTGGTSLYSYQWYLNGNAVSGATGATWTFTPTSAGSDTVCVKVTDSATTPSSATSNTAHVTVNPELAVTVSPLTSAIYLSQNQTYTSDVDGTGTSPYSYQWYLNGSSVSGATGASWTFVPTSTGTYQIYVKATDGVNEVAQPSNAQLTVNPKPAMGVTISPSSVVIDLSESVPFTSSVTGGTPSFTYQWYLNGNAVSGATSNTWTFTPTSTGTYEVYFNVTDSLNVKGKSNIATVTANPLLLVTISPSSKTIDLVQSQTFTSTVSGGTSPYTYQWYLNGVAVSGATSASWAFTPSSSGSYNVYVNVTDSVNLRAKSNIASVTVNSALSVTVSPSSVVMDVGQPQSFTATVSGGKSPNSYQWYLNGALVSGATSSLWTFKSSSSGSCTVYVKVTDAVSVVATSNTATVIVNGALSVSISPGSVTLDVGLFQLFTASPVGGTPPYTYQWYLDSAPVSGATSVTWTFVPNSPGTYTVYVIVTDSADVDPSAQSPSIQVVVNSAPTIAILPGSVVLDVGQSQLFNSSVSGGTSPYTYQWYLNNTLVLGATSNSWTFTPTSSGSYTVYLNVTDSVSIIAISLTSNATVSPPSREFQLLFFFLPFFTMAILLAPFVLIVFMMEAKRKNITKRAQ